MPHRFPALPKMPLLPGTLRRLLLGGVLLPAAPLPSPPNDLPLQNSRNRGFPALCQSHPSQDPFRSPLLRSLRPSLSRTHRPPVPRIPSRRACPPLPDKAFPPWPPETRSDNFSSPFPGTGPPCPSGTAGRSPTPGPERSAPEDPGPWLPYPQSSRFP